MGCMWHIRFRSAAVIGTGMMGPGIGLTLALGGLPTTLVGRTREGADAGLRKARALADVLRVNELAGDGETANALERLSATIDLSTTVRTADLVIESGPEDLGWKQDLFAQLDGMAPPDAALASNTSGLSITAIAARCARPERILTTHYWNPPHLVPLVEIVRGEKTSDDTVKAVRDLLTKCGKTPVIVKKDRPGQLGNRLQMALVREAAYIIQEGIAEAADIDAVIRNGLGVRMPAYGTLEHMDIAGLDLTISVLDYVAGDLCSEPLAPEYLRRLVSKGDLGAKSGRGFYDWSGKSADEVKARRDAFLIQVLRGRRAGRATATQAAPESSPSR
jgi:3-hydroxybutyryl-CoA dehydrogenase